MSDLLQFVVAPFFGDLHNKKVCAIISNVLRNFKI